MKEHIINLNAFRSPEVELFTGRDRGKAVRHTARLDDLERRPDARVIIQVPDDVYTLASSFFLGMFGPSVIRFGREGFLERYSFVGENVPNFLEDGIAEALKEGQRDRLAAATGGIL